MTAGPGPGVSAHKPAVAVGFCLLMVLVSLSSMVPPAGPSAQDSPARATYYTPQQNELGLNLTSTGVLSVPYNHTFSGGSLSVTPMWAEAPDTATRFGIDANTGWSGTHDDTQGIGHGGQLSLATESTLASLTDFETLIETLPDWEGQGPHHNAWNVLPLNGTAVQHQPSTATDGQRVLATQALGGLSANMSGCLASPEESVPAFVNQYNLTFDHWLSFKDDDAAWVEARTTGGAWQVLTPRASYTNTSTLSGTPGAVWSGQSSAWEQAHFNLDGVIPSAATTLEIRFCFQTSTTAGDRAGWFLDNFTLTNLGDLPGAWFHGNMSGDYANNADGRLYLPADLSAFTGPMEIEFWANWDIEGSFSDNLLVYVSVNNGTTWAPVSGIPGLPGNGISIQGNYYNDESLGWRPITYNLPSGVSSHQNASHVLFMFQVTTNHQNGYGGFASSSWEGVAIDNVHVVHRPGTAQEERLQVSNFSSLTTGQVGDQRGWLDGSSSRINEWNWTTSFGVNPPESRLESFESSMTTPPGWVIEGTWPDGWEIGQTRNTSGYGPGVFHSGNNGAAVNLTTKYTNNIYTHLTTQEYSIPTNASARLSFRSWVCTEANWDGGGVSISTDGGQQWWWLPPQLNGFHDQISTVNTNSPFFSQGIIDGSSVAGGCGASNPRDFELKTYDLSNLSGQSLKARFSFFSDTYVEGDGWYIDDAGIEVDVFEPAGSWISKPISPDPIFGYGWLDGWYERPDGTTLLFDILDAQHNPIPQHEHLQLPAQLALDPNEHPTVHVRVRMSTNDTFVTPLVHSLSVGRTTYIGPQHVLDRPSGAATSSMDENGTLQVAAPFSLPLPRFVACPHDGYRLTTVGDNLTWTTPNGQVVASSHSPSPIKTTFLNHSLGGAMALMPAFTLTATGGETFVRAKAELDCVIPPQAPSMTLGWNNVSVMTWPPIGMDDHLGLNTRWTQAVHNGSDILWAHNESSPSIPMENSSLQLAYQTLSRLSTNLPPGEGPAFSLMVSNASEGAEVRIDGVVQTIGHGGIIQHQGTSPCASVASVAAFSTNRSLLTCALDITVVGVADVKVLNLMHLLPDTTVEVDLSATSLNAAKQASYDGDMRAVLDVPLHIMTQRGGLRVAVGASAVPVMVEQVDAPSYTRWLPEQTVSFTTHHTRLNPLDASEDAPDITKVAFHLSPSGDLNDAVVHVELDRIQDAPRFRQLDGVGLAHLDAAASSVSCTLNTCSVQWVLTSTWLLNDMDDLHVLTMAQDENGLEAGPEVFVRKTAFNEIENDLEVVDFTVSDTQQRRIDDWTNSFWPYHLNENQTLHTEGRVRMEGIANQWVDAGEAEVTVTLRAVPPKNLSGGPDEWLNEPINWSRSWSAEVTSGGWFSVSLSTPAQAEGLPSNTFFELRPSLTRRGPVDAVTTSEDRTVVLTPTRFLHDTVPPEVDSLHVLDSGQEVVADGHVSMYGKDIALRLQLSDPEGLSSQLEVWTWLERRDDANGNGIMEESEYTMQTVSLNRGVAQLEVDLPLLSSQSVVPDNSPVGRVSVVLKGEDLAGNPLTGGGSFGESDDLATISVQRRSDTTVDVESLRLDRINNRLLAGHEHTFSFALGDANGISSLESLRLALVGETNESSCFVHYEPRFGGVEFDELCFIEAPTVHVVKRPLVTTYDVTVSFRLDWNASTTIAAEGGTPSLKVFDEGQDLGLGLYQLGGLSWTPGTKVGVEWLNITDMQAPFGDNNGSTYWFHRNEAVHHRIGVFHNGTDVLARDLPATGSFVWTLSDGERSEIGHFNMTESGAVEFNVSMNENVMYNDTGTLTVEAQGYDERAFEPLHYNVVVDDAAPKLVLAPGMLENLPSNELEAVEVSLSISDDTDMPPTALKMHAVFYRLGQPVAGTEKAFFLPLREVVNEFTVYNGTVNFLPNDVALTRSDVLIVWFEASDRSGRALTGYGTERAPLNVGLTWYAFEPVLTDLSATPFRPTVGENVSIYARIANDGLLPGEMNVLLRDDEGRIMANETRSLASGEWVNFVWNIEAWKVGRLGLNLEIVNHTPQVPVPMADIKAGEGDDANSSMATLSLSALSLLVAGMVLFVVRQQRAQRAESYHLERIRRIVSHRRPPPKPFDLADIPQEE